MINVESLASLRRGGGIHTLIIILMCSDVTWQLEAVKGKLTVREGVNEKHWKKTHSMITNEREEQNQ